MKKIVLAAVVALSATPALAADAAKPAQKKTLAPNCEVPTKAGMKTVHAKNAQTCAKRKGTWVTTAKAPAAPAPAAVPAVAPAAPKK